MKTYTLPITALILAILLLASVLMLKPFHNATASGGWFGAQSHLQTATTTQVGPDETVTLFSDQISPTCRNRVITTFGEEVFISFDEATGFGGADLNGQTGHLQTASTTKSYDSGLYGCGALKAYAAASTTITISSF